MAPATKLAQNLALFLLATDGNKKLGFYMPSTSFSFSDPPQFDDTQFAEAPFTANLLGADPSAITPDPQKGAGLMVIYGPTTFELES